MKIIISFFFLLFICSQTKANIINGQRNSCHDLLKTFFKLLNTHSTHIISDESQKVFDENVLAYLGARTIAIDSNHLRKCSISSNTSKFCYRVEFNDLIPSLSQKNSIKAQDIKFIIDETLTETSFELTKEVITFKIPKNIINKEEHRNMLYRGLISHPVHPYTVLKSAVSQRQALNEPDFFLKDVQEEMSLVAEEMIVEAREIESLLGFRKLSQTPQNYQQWLKTEKKVDGPINRVKWFLSEKKNRPEEFEKRRVAIAKREQRAQEEITDLEVFENVLSLRMLGVASTGFGKTMVLQRVLRKLLEVNPSPTKNIHMIMADQTMLTDQLALDALNVIGDLDHVRLIHWGGDKSKDSKLSFDQLIELAKSEKENGKQIVFVTTTQSFKARLSSFEGLPDKEKVNKLKTFLNSLIFDEVHHAGADGITPFLEDLLAWKNHVFFYGTTATPHHSKQTIMNLFHGNAFWAYLDSFEDFFNKGGEIVRSIGEVVGQFFTAVDRGELVGLKNLHNPEEMFRYGRVSDVDPHRPIHNLLRSNFQNDRIRALNKFADDFINDLTTNKFGFISAPTKITADELKTVLDEKNITPKRVIEVFYSGMRNEKEVIRKFRNGEINYLISPSKLDEGINFPFMSLYIDINRSIHPRRFMQRIGRVVRVYPGKEHAQIITYIEDTTTNVMRNAAFFDEIAKRQLIDNPKNISEGNLKSLNDKTWTRIKNKLKRVKKRKEVENLDFSGVAKEISEILLDVKSKLRAGELVHWTKLKEHQDFDLFEEFKIDKPSKAKLYINFLNKEAKDFLESLLKGSTPLMERKFNINQAAFIIVDKLLVLYEKKRQGVKVSFDDVFLETNLLERLKTYKIPKDRLSLMIPYIEEINPSMAKFYKELLEKKQNFVEDKFHDGLIEKLNLELIGLDGKKRKGELLHFDHFKKTSVFNNELRELNWQDPESATFYLDMLNPMAKEILKEIIHNSTSLSNRIYQINKIGLLFIDRLESFYKRHLLGVEQSFEQLVKGQEHIKELRKFGISKSNLGDFSGHLKDIDHELGTYYFKLWEKSLTKRLSIKKEQIAAHFKLSLERIKINYKTDDLIDLEKEIGITYLADLEKMGITYQNSFEGLSEHLSQEDFKLLSEISQNQFEVIKERNYILKYLHRYMFEIQRQKEVFYSGTIVDLYDVFEKNSFDILLQNRLLRKNPLDLVYYVRKIKGDAADFIAALLKDKGGKKLGHDSKKAIAEILDNVLVELKNNLAPSEVISWHKIKKHSVMEHLSKSGLRTVEDVLSLTSYLSKEAKWFLQEATSYDGMNASLFLENQYFLKLTRFLKDFEDKNGGFEKFHSDILLKNPAFMDRIQKYSYDIGFIIQEIYKIDYDLGIRLKNSKYFVRGVTASSSIEDIIRAVSDEVSIIPDLYLSEHSFRSLSLIPILEENGIYSINDLLPFKKYLSDDSVKKLEKIQNNTNNLTEAELIKERFFSRLALFLHQVDLNNELGIEAELKDVFGRFEFNIVLNHYNYGLDNHFKVLDHLEKIDPKASAIFENLISKASPSYIERSNQYKSNQKFLNDFREKIEIVKNLEHGQQKYSTYRIFNDLAFAQKLHMRGIYRHNFEESIFTFDIVAKDIGDFLRKVDDNFEEVKRKVVTKRKLDNDPLKIYRKDKRYKKAIDTLIKKYSRVIERKFDKSSTQRSVTWSDFKDIVEFSSKEYSLLRMNINVKDLEKVNKSNILRFRQFFPMDIRSMIDKVSFNSSLRGKKLVSRKKLATNVSEQIIKLRDQYKEEIRKTIILSDSTIKELLNKEKLKLSDIEKELSLEARSILKEAKELDSELKQEKKNFENTKKQRQINQERRNLERQGDIQNLLKKREKVADELTDYILDNEDDLTSWEQLYLDEQLGPMLNEAQMSKDNFSKWAELLSRDDFEILKKLN